MFIMLIMQIDHKRVGKLSPMLSWHWRAGWVRLSGRHQSHLAPNLSAAQ
jgi:hypothetical protein